MPDATRSAIALALLINFACLVPSAGATTQVEPVKLTKGQREIVMRDVRKTLKDPDSAKFGNIMASRSDKGGLTVCGFVNAKNAFGGYIGMSPFVGMLIEELNGFVLLDIAGAKTSSSVVLQVCRDSGITLRE